MSEPALLEVLRQTRFFNGAPDAELQQIASVARLECYPVGRVLFRAGERLPRSFLVVEGSVALELPVSGRGSRSIHTVGRGELVGWSPLLNQEPMTATARTLTTAQVIALDAAQVLALCHHDTQLGFALMRRVALALAQRLNATRLQLLDIYRYELPPAADEFRTEAP
jgi:CRP-like cAMP-binding protein